MSITLDKSMFLTEADYLKFQRLSGSELEFSATSVINGHLHSLLCGNMITELNIVLRDRPYRVYPADMRVKVQATGLFTYPDVSVVCGDPQFADDVFDTLLNPILLIEVLSPSTEAYDRGKKFQDYRQIASLQEYLLISQDRARIERYLRQDDKTWNLTDAVGLDARLKLPSIDCTLNLSDVYRKVTFDDSDVTEFHGCSLRT